MSGPSTEPTAEPVAEQPNLEAPRSGRPFLFTDAKELAMKIQNYFDNCDPHITKRQVENGRNNDNQTIWAEREVMTDQEPYTVTGLARSLKVSRQTINNYRDPAHYTDEISPEVRQELMDTLEDAIQRVEEFNEKQLHRSGLSNGIKFSLTNNFGWVDKSVVDSNVRTVESDLDDLDQPDGRDTIADAAAAELAAQDAKTETPPENGASDDSEPGPAPQE